MKASENDYSLNTPRTVVRRYVKLMGGYWFIYIIALIIALLDGRFSQTYGELSILKVYHGALDFFGLSNAMNTPTLNGTWWYMSYAILLLALIPLINLAVRRLGGLSTIILSILIPAYAGLPDTGVFRWYILTVVLGVVLAHTDFFESVKNFCAGIGRSAGAMILCVIALFVLNYFRWNLGVYWFVDAAAAVIMAVISVLCFKIGVLGKVLEFIGKHSMNMFLIHSFVFYYYFRSYVYMWKAPVVITLFLLISTLVLSVVIEYAKKVLGWNRMIAHLQNKIAA